MQQCGCVPLRGGGSIIRNIVGFRWRFRQLLSSLGGMVSTPLGIKGGNKGGEKRFPATALYCPPPLFPLSLVRERAPFREQSERNLHPATDKITIVSEEEFPVKSVAIADMQGQLLAILPVNDVRCILNVHKLAPGTYIAHINTRAGNTKRKFVVKK